MSKKIREFIFVTSLSFTLVILINTVFNIFQISTIVTPWDILAVFFVCVVISFFIIIGDRIPYIKEHLFLYNYAVVIVIGSGIQTLLIGHVYWDNLMIQIIMLTVVFFGVGFGVYGIHCKEAMMINQKLDETHKRNQK
ncbi:MAG: hypothetical protein RR630_05665 [Coprobacillus sp.]